MPGVVEDRHFGPLKFNRIFITVSQKNLHAESDQLIYSKRERNVKPQ